MFSGEGLARRVLLRALQETGVYDELDPEMRVLAVVAMSHQEDMRMQHLCREAWAQLVLELSPDDPSLALADKLEDNYHAMESFGRFPERNALLERRSTAAEKAFLGEPK